MKIDFISDGSRQKNFQRCKNEKSDGSDSFWVGWQKTDPADPAREKEGICRRRDRLCGNEKQNWGM